MLSVVADCFGQLWDKENALGAEKGPMAKT